MATKAEAVKIAVLEVEMKEVNKKLDHLSETVDELPRKLIEVLDERYAMKKDVEEIKETILPFTKFRRNAWAALITFVLVVGAIGVIMWEVERFKK